MKDTLPYQVIRDFYGIRRAKRTCLLYMRHIDQGLLLLEDLGAKEATKEAWCLHPIFQLEDSFTSLMQGEFPDPRPLLCDPDALVLTMEYRSVANAYLTPDVHSSRLPRISPIREVNLMLIADKVHNWRDARVYLFPRFPKIDPEPLNWYFWTWMKVLGVTSEERERLEYILSEDDRKNPPR